MHHLEVVAECAGGHETVDRRPNGEPDAAGRPVERHGLEDDRFGERRLDAG